MALWRRKRRWLTVVLPQASSKPGDTVRRPAICCSPFIAKFLCHLDEQGFTYAPRYLDADSAGRDALSSLSG